MVNDSDNKTPTQLSCEVAALLKQANEEADSHGSSDEAKLRDLTQERVSQERVSLENDPALPEEDIERQQQHKKRKKENSRHNLLEEAKHNPKKALKLQKKERQRQLKRDLKMLDVEPDPEAQSRTKVRQRTLMRMGQAVKRLLNYATHIRRMPGDQAGTFDDKIEEKRERNPKRAVEHDFSFSRQTIIEYFTTKVGNVTVKGAVEHKNQANSQGQVETVQSTVRVEDAVTDRGRYLADEEMLGRISPDAVLNAIENNSQGISR